MLCSIIKHFQIIVRMKRLQKNKTDVLITPSFIHYQALLCFHFSADTWASRESEGSFPKKALWNDCIRSTYSSFKCNSYYIVKNTTRTCTISILQVLLMMMQKGRSYLLIYFLRNDTPTLAQLSLKEPGLMSWVTGEVNPLLARLKPF